MREKIKVLWIINASLHMDEKGSLDLNALNGCGWLAYYLCRLIKDERYDIAVTYPQRESRAAVKWKAEGTSFYGFYSHKKPGTRRSDRTKRIFEEIIAKERPDLVHVWGTEYPHSLELIDAFGHPLRTVISVQGLISICAKHYMADLPARTAFSWTIKDILRLDNLKCQQINFERRGRFEKLAIKKAGFIIGRTDWDEAASYMLNPGVKYYHVNETLRDVFYERKNSWNVAECRRNSVFVSQAGYPIKGFHKILEACGLLKKDYPKIKICVSGKALNIESDLNSLIRQDGYAHYIKTLINRLGIRDNIVFLGVLTAEEMAEQMLGSHVFVSASSMENESNSLSEARLLGMPVIASVAGGTACRVHHGIDGFQYQYEESYMLAYYLRKIFSDDELATALGRKASQNASIVNDRENNYNQLLNTYEEILNASCK